MIAVTSPGPGPGAVGVDAERPLEVEAAQLWIVGFHAADIPELAADFVQAVRHRRAFGQHANRTVVVRDTHAFVGRGHRADDENGTVVEEARVGDERRDVRGRGVSPAAQTRRTRAQRPPAGALPSEPRVPSPEPRSHHLLLCLPRQDRGQCQQRGLRLRRSRSRRHAGTGPCCRSTAVARPRSGRSIVSCPPGPHTEFRRAIRRR